MRRSVAPFIALLGLLLGGCREAPPNPVETDDHPPQHGGRFVYALRVEPATLNFVSGTDQASVLVQKLVADGLVDHDASLRVVPRLATSWEFSGDGRVLTFRLRRGVRFHDGVPFTSADVLHTYERIIDPESKAVGRLDSFLPIERVEAPDPETVRVLYREPYAPALRAWEVPILPRHLDRGETMDGSPLNRAPIGTGPFRFVSWEAGRSIALAAYDDYWGGRPFLDDFVFQVIPSQETALQALLAGEVDYAGMSPVQWEAHGHRADFDRRFRSVRFVPLFLYYIAWRTDGSNPFFSDPAVRRALSLALDREGYVRSILRGLGRVAHSPFHPAVLAPDPESGAGRFDPDEAARLLDDAGWRIDPTTGLRARGGIPFRFRLLVFSGGQDHVQFSQVAQESLRQLGIEMSIQRLDWPSLWGRLKSGDFEAALSGTVPGADPDSLYGMLHSSQIDGGQNYAAFDDPEIDALLERGRRTLDAEARDTIYRRIDRRVEELQPYSFLFYPVVVSALSREVGGVTPSPLGILNQYPGPTLFHRSDASRR
jgi:peptide/nickel transport system substrate-binding protein